MQLPANNKVYTVFGWTVHQRIVPAGAKYTVGLAKSHDPVSIGMQTLWTSGYVTGINMTTGKETIPRVAGTFNQEFTHVSEPGRYIFTCHEESERWCISDQQHAGKRANLTAFRLAQDALSEITESTNLFLAKGELLINGQKYAAPAAIKIHNVPVEVKAVSNCLGLIFGEEYVAP